MKADPENPTADLPFTVKLAHNIGLIVLESQQLEKHIKVIVALCDPREGKTILERHKQLERYALGQAVKRLLTKVTVTEGNPEDFEAYLRGLLDRRNLVIHHFFETYATELTESRFSDVLQSLATLLFDLRGATAAFKTANQNLIDDLGDGAGDVLENSQERPA